MKCTIAVFDFDGTLTQKDTLLEFIKFSCGSLRFFCGFILYSPILVLMKLKLYPNWKAKEKIFSYFFKGMRYEEFKDYGISFSELVESFKRNEIVNKLQGHISQGDEVYVITASIDDWVKPWCEKYGVKNVLGTRIEVNKDEIITGKFLTKNCYGQEKVNRLLQCVPNRDEYYLYAYGDSRGDKEILSFADKGLLV